VEPEEKKRSSLSLQTLLISSGSAVVAAAVVPLFWQRGSLIATAITPIVVALASEALNRPAKAITAAAPKVARRSATGAALRSRQPTGVGARGEGPERVGRGRPPATQRIRSACVRRSPSAGGGRSASRWSPGCSPR
jgi:hypothetical protein